jgi:flagellar hook-basal body complex protein FliE
VSVLGVGAAAATPFVPPTISSTGPSSASKSADSGLFAQGLKQVSGLTDAASTAAEGVATGGLQDVHSFTTAAAKAQIGVELTVALRNRAVEAYQDIMRMQV